MPQQHIGGGEAPVGDAQRVNVRQVGQQVSAKRETGGRVV